jgi:hypothetical protein
MKEVKHNTDHTLINTDPEILSKVEQNTLEIVDVCLREGGGYFQHTLQICSTSASQEKN